MYESLWMDGCRQTCMYIWVDGCKQNCMYMHIQISTNMQSVIPDKMSLKQGINKSLKM